MKDKEELIRLDIAFDYPVHWGFEKILRDLIQNFFDSIGSERFGEEFYYSYEKMSYGYYQLTLETSNHPFDHEWLIYIGGSTKTEKEGNYIGKYGEGFKICMLSLMKSGITDISMHSKDWTIRPCTYEEKIDRSTVLMLGYRYMQVPEDTKTSLVIKRIPREYLRYMEEALLHFFYPGNPLFGEKIAEGKDYTIYSSNGTRIPCTQPLNFRGILYLNYLARGRLSIPFYVMLSGRNLEDTPSRKRKTLDPFDVWESMYRLTRRMNPEDSLKLLILLRPYWNDLPKSTDDISTYYYVICQLVRNVSSSSQTKHQFCDEYSDLVYIDRAGSDKKANSRIRQARIWAREQTSGEMVNPVFRLLGAVSLIEKFSQEDTHFLPAEPYQAEMVNLLFSLYKKIIPPMYHVELPEIWIGSREDADRDPLCHGDKDFWTHKRIKHQKYNLQKIIMCDDDFKKEAYDDTLVSFLDKMLHIFGSSRSAQMNVIFTALGSWLINQADIVIEGRKHWDILADWEKANPRHEVIHKSS